MWSCAELCGVVWSCVELCRVVWSCVELCGVVRSCVWKIVPGTFLFVTKSFRILT